MSGVDDLSSATVHEAPEPCRACMWWQTRPGRREPDRERWMAATEESFGAWGKLYRDGDRTVGMIQYGPAERFARSRVLPGGPPSPDAVLVTCAYLVDERSPWALQSLFLAAIGESRDRRFPALEAFAYRYGPGELFASRFMTHRTVFPKDFLSDFGFHTLRAAGRVELMRLELGGLEPVAERGRLERVKARFAPVPARLAAP
jgi:hypothetical protein